MTLIAAVKHEGGFTVVTDTKVTYTDDAIQTARVFTFALPKIVLLRDDLTVAVAGEKPTALVRQLIQRRADGLTEIIGHLRQAKNAGFVVVSGLMLLLRVKRGCVRLTVDLAERMVS